MFVWKTKPILKYMLQLDFISVSQIDHIWQIIKSTKCGLEIAQKNNYVL